MVRQWEITGPDSKTMIFFGFNLMNKFLFKDVA